MAESRHNRPNYMKLESKVHRLWREEAARFHQNMFEAFCSGPNKLGYHVVKKGDDLEEKIRIAIYGCDSDRDNLEENEKKMIKQLAEKIEKYSPEEFRQKHFTIVAIVYVHVLLNNENAVNESHVIFRVLKFVSAKGGEKKEGEKKEVKEIKCQANNVEIEYISGERAVYDLNKCEAYFIDCDQRKYHSWKDYKQDNWLPEGKMCAPRDGVYRAEEGEVLVEILDTPSRTDKGGALQLFDASSSLLGKVGAGICLTSTLTPIGAVALTGVSLATASSFYSCVRSAGKLLDRAIHDQELQPGNKEARNLWFDTVLSGVTAAAGFKILVSGYIALKSNIFKFGAASSELAAIGSRNTTLMIISSNSCSVLQVVINRIIDRVILDDWSDLISFKNVLYLFLNIISPVESIKQTLNEILTVAKPFFNIASSVGHYLSFSFDKLINVVGETIVNLKNIAIISGKFLFNVTVGLLDKRFKEVHDGFRDLLLGRITLVTFAINTVKYSADIFSWFENSFHNAKKEYRQLCDQKNARNILDTVGMENEENMRKMFKELEDVIQECKVNNTDNKVMESLIKLVDKFRSTLDADCNVNEFLFSVKVVCAYVKKCFRVKESKYDNECKFARDVSGDLFDINNFNKQFGLSSEAGGDTATQFFAQTVALLQTDGELSKMRETYREMADEHANKAIPSIQTVGIRQYLFVNPPEVTDVSQDRMWQNLFKAQTGIAVDDDNVQMEREVAEGRNIILIRPKTNNLKFILAYFFIAEAEPILKGILSVCTSVKED